MRRLGTRISCCVAARIALVWSLTASAIGCASEEDDHASTEEARLSQAELSALPYDMRVVVTGLAAPWAISWGPDQRLWLTERVGKRVTRVDPKTGARKTALRIDEVFQASGQDGLLGMALHPALLTGKGSDYVFLAYTYDADPGQAVDRRARIVRYTYDARRETLGEPRILLSGLPASQDHNSGRLIYGPDDKLYYTIGDQGNNQFERKCLRIRAQALPSRAEIAQRDFTKYQGKILRIAKDGSIPADNPVLSGVRSHIYTLGHRNAQGLAFSPSGRLYASEQGPKTDDEINLIVAGKNYGWPNVAGFQDDNAYVYGAWAAAPACASLPFSDYVLPKSVPISREWDFHAGNFAPPLLTFYTVEDDFNFQDPACRSAPYICWPTIAPSSLAFYAARPGSIAAWNDALLIPSLKKGSVYLVGLSHDGLHVRDRGTPLFKTTNRYRGLAIGPDLRTFYVITDTQGDTSGPTRGTTTALTHRGAILAFKVRG